MTDQQAMEVISVMRELIAAIDRSNAVNAAASAVPQSSPDSDAALLQYAHSAARFNEQMAQTAVDKTNSFLERQQDRWHLTLQQLKNVTE